MACCDEFLPGSESMACLSTNSSVPSLDQLDGQFAVQEMIQALVKSDAANVNAIVALPPNCEVALWVYEHLRAIIATLNMWTAELESECNQQTCPLMIATADWEFLCATHPGPPRKCCAIDYFAHTLNSFSSLLNDVNDFPNRSVATLSIPIRSRLSFDHSIKVPAKSAEHFPNVARRLYRLFAHAYCHHNATFQQLEVRGGSRRALKLMVSLCCSLKHISANDFCRSVLHTN